jgi:endoglucanase
MNAPWRRREILTLLGAAALNSRPAFSATDGVDRRARALARGFNLPDQVPAQPSARPERATLKWLRARGMVHVRLPLRGESLMTRFSDKATIAKTLDDFERALDLLLGLDFAVTADMHPASDFAHLHRADPEAALAALTDGWRNLARSIARFPTSRVFAELLNEPNVDDAIWRVQAERLAADLRRALPATTFITGPAPYQRVEALAGWRPLADKNIIYAFHFYDPMAFTHQGLTWEPSSPLSHLANVPFPTSRDDAAMTRLLQTLRARGEDALAQSIDEALDKPWNAQTIASQFAPLAAWSQTHEAPVILNEFGALRFKAPRAARLAWLKAVREAAEANKFGWAHWDYNQGFGLLDETGKPDAALIDVLLPT